jgi:uncharacterized protein GlcG (DUF336 family)
MDKTATWTSDNEAVATVDADGTVTCVAAGDATITVTTTSGNNKATCALTVVPAVFVVANTADWKAALEAISTVSDGTDVKSKAFEIQITKDFSTAGIIFDDYSITGAYKEVRLTGDRTISLDSASTGSLIAAAENQKFVINGPTLKGITTNTYPLVYVGGGSTVELASGTIAGNVNTSSNFANNGDPRGSDGCGGGVFVDGGTFTMTNGTISGNKAGAGGNGVWIAPGGKQFTPQGGTVQQD